MYWSKLGQATKLRPLRFFKIIVYFQSNISFLIMLIVNTVDICTSFKTEKMYMRFTLFYRKLLEI
jgi:hypothetical protein